MSDSSCGRIHKYVIVTTAGISDPFYRDQVEEAKNLFDALDEGLQAYWVAFHEVPIEQLVNNCDSIMSYCAQETKRIESNEPLPKYTVDFAKRS